MSGGRSSVRRAPRLGPDDLIAPHITRLGRFRSINPTKARKLPGFSKFLGFVGWVVLLEESYRRARKASAQAQGPADAPRTTDQSADALP